MKTAFIDTSALAAILFDEPSSASIQRILGNFDAVCASNLLEAEIRSAAVRESISQREVDLILSRVKWVNPDRPLSREFQSIVLAGVRLRGADLWHVACALYMASDPWVLYFVTLDETQALAAERMGFKVLPERVATPDVREPAAVYNSAGTKTKRKKAK